MRDYKHKSVEFEPNLVMVWISFIAISVIILISLIGRV